VSTTTLFILAGLCVWLGILTAVAGICIAGARDDRLARRAARAREEDGPRRCRALVADGPVPDGVDEDAKAVAAEWTDGRRGRGFR
jgi:hypothetical protein